MNRRIVGNERRVRRLSHRKDGFEYEDADADADALYTRLEAKNTFSFLQPFDPQLGHVHQVFRFLYLTGYEMTNIIRKV